MGTSSSELKSMTCPQCGAPMSHGYIAGHWVRLRWTDTENTKTIFAGKPLRRERTWMSAPTIEAARCEDCKLGLFRYDY